MYNYTYIMYASDIYFVFNHQLFTYFSLDRPTVWWVPRLLGGVPDLDGGSGH